MAVIRKATETDRDIAIVVAIIAIIYAIVSSVMIERHKK